MIIIMMEDREDCNLNRSFSEETLVPLSSQSIDKAASQEQKISCRPNTNNSRNRNLILKSRSTARRRPENPLCNYGWSCENVSTTSADENIQLSSDKVFMSSPPEENRLSPAKISLLLSFSHLLKEEDFANLTNRKIKPSNSIMSESQAKHSFPSTTISQPTKQNPPTVVRVNLRRPQKLVQRSDSDRGSSSSAVVAVRSFCLRPVRRVETFTNDHFEKKPPAHQRHGPPRRPTRPISQCDVNDDDTENKVENVASVCDQVSLKSESRADIDDTVKSGSSNLTLPSRVVEQHLTSSVSGVIKNIPVHHRNRADTVSGLVSPSSYSSTITSRSQDIKLTSLCQQPSPASDPVIYDDDTTLCSSTGSLSNSSVQGVDKLAVVSSTSFLKNNVTSSTSTLNIHEPIIEIKNKRDMIVGELYSTEQQYVESLQIMVEKYMIPMKSQGILDDSLVDEIFYKINEIYMHHATFVTFLARALKNWNSSSTVGDVIQKTFSKQTVIQSYISFIEHFPRAEKVLDEISTKLSFQRFIEQCERDTKTKLPLKAHIVKPAQRIPRYELLLKRLIENTAADHPDSLLLREADTVIHKLIVCLNNVKESAFDEDLLETIKKLELLLITDLSAPDRVYLRHDMVSISTQKDPCCIWLFSDTIIFSIIKRKAGSINHRTSLLLQSPTGHDFVENVKHKLWLKVSLEAVEVLQAEIEQGTLCKSLSEKQQKQELEADYESLKQILEYTSKLKCPHQAAEEAIQELYDTVSKQLFELVQRSSAPDLDHTLLVRVNTQDGSKNLTIMFPTAEKKGTWEMAFISAKRKLALKVESSPPELVQFLQITKTRAGMQLSCAAHSMLAGQSLNGEDEQVWVCSSDGFVGHVCLLKLEPEPMVTLHTPVPGCNTRILCICSVPARPSLKRFCEEVDCAAVRGLNIIDLDAEENSELVDQSSCSSSSCHNDDMSQSIARSHSGTPRLQVAVKKCEEISEDAVEEGYSSEASTDSGSLGDTCDNIHLQDLVIDDIVENEADTTRSLASLSKDINPVKDLQTIDAGISTMWLGTEDGSIQIFSCVENIKTSKLKLKIQQHAGVLSLVYLDSKVFVSLANGDVLRFKHKEDGYSWDCNDPDVARLSNSDAPIGTMLAVADKVWCASAPDILILNTSSLLVETRFTAFKKTTENVSSMALSDIGVWISGQSSSCILLYHAESLQLLFDINIAPAIALQLQSTDNIIRQHKIAVLRITALLACKDILWVGTSAGIILTLRLTKLLSKNSSTPPNLSGLSFGHSGQVRFLTSVEIFADNVSSSSMSSVSPSKTSVTDGSTFSSSVYVISGGDGYEDFQNCDATDIGRDDSTNHLLVWHVG